MIKRLTLVPLLSSFARLSLALDSTISESEITFTAPSSDSITITVSGPNGFNNTYEFTSSPATLISDDINNASDGQYSYSALAITKVGEEFVSDDNGRSDQYRDIVESESTSGAFSLSAGDFVTAANKGEE